MLLNKFLSYLCGSQVIPSDPNYSQINEKLLGTWD
jgi:hypothetical protein